MREVNFLVKTYSEFDRLCAILKDIGFSEYARGGDLLDEWDFLYDTYHAHFTIVDIDDHYFYCLSATPDFVAKVNTYSPTSPDGYERDELVAIIVGEALTK